METLDFFRVFPSEFEATSRTLHALIPTVAFTTRRRRDSLYEAIVIVGAAY